MKNYNITPIGIIKTPYRSKVQAPRQTAYSGGADGTIEVYEKYSEGLEGIERFRHIIVLFYFHRTEGFRLKAWPPDSDVSRGVFASRSPHRPNHIGISVLRLISRKGNILSVKDVDMLDGTPVIDIKPYVAGLDNKK
jgi:tRNA (adenine37-N6)-methyltransferase